MKKAAKTIDLDFPSQAQLSENDAWPKATAKTRDSTSQAKVTCAKKTQGAELRAPTVRAKGETGETVKHFNMMQS